MSNSFINHGQYPLPDSTHVRLVSIHSTANVTISVSTFTSTLSLTFSDSYTFCPLTFQRN